MAIPNFKKLDDDKRQEMVLKVEQLESVGCKGYQLLEWPAILKQDMHHIECKAQLLQQLHMPISIPILRVLFSRTFEKDPKQISKLVDAKLQDWHGCISNADFWRMQLKCATDEMVYELLKVNKRLISRSGSIDAKVKKLKMLLERGIEVDDIRQNSHSLLNVSLESLANRLQQIKEKNVDVDLTFLHRSDKQFNTWIQNKEVTLENQRQIEILLERNFEDICGIMSTWKYLSSKTLIVPKVKYLLDAGFSSGEIISNIDIFQFSLTEMENGFNLITHLEHASLVHLTKYLVNNSLNRKQVAYNRKYLSFLLGCETTDLRHLHTSLKVMFSQRKSVVEDNLEFLLDCGFKRESIQQVCVLLSHDTHTLKYHHSKLPYRKELQPFEDWQQDEVKLLNFLQYFIEKESNFVHPVVLEVYKETP